MRVSRRLTSGGSMPGGGAWVLLSPVLLLTLLAPDPQRNPYRTLASTIRPAGSAGGAPTLATVSDVNVKEIVPDKYLKKYLRWKAEYLSTEVGRRQWGRYANDKSFTLTIVVTPELGHGGMISDYRWDASGKLVGATISLGGGLDDGVLSPFYYPVTSALAPADEPNRVSGEVLAAAKMAHEFGHVNRAAEADASLYQLQNDTMVLYAKVFKDNGYNKHDPRLAELARRMGGTPPEIKRAREYGAEANALIYLEERMAGEKENRELFRKIRKSIKEYAEGHLQLPK
jgi:hypothetical protein